MATATRAAYGEALCEFGSKDKRIVALDADLASATGTGKFKEQFPERFFDFGIAEQNMVGAAAGLAREGLIPFVSTFAVFGAGRAFEIIRNAVCTGKMNVKFCFSHSGVTTGEDGGSHQSIEDIALMRVLPNMTIFVPCDAIETKKAVAAAIQIDGPVYIRTSRPAFDNVTKESTPFIPGKANVLKSGNDVCIIATGIMVRMALEAAVSLEKKGISAAVVDMHTIKPIDKNCILKMAKKVKGFVTAEEHSIIGGLGAAVEDVLIGKYAGGFEKVGVEDVFGQSGKALDLLKEYGLTAEAIVKKAQKAIK